MTDSIATLTTAHLLGKTITLPHFHEIHRLHNDPLVMKTLSPNGKPLSEEATYGLESAVAR